jgi:hypothetical protein
MFTSDVRRGLRFAEAVDAGWVKTVVLNLG